MIIRFFDVFFSFLAIVMLSPIFVLVSIILLITGEHEIVFMQRRMGKDGKSFKVFKFSTMLKKSEQMPGGLLTQKNDPRILPVGVFLRKTKINELPQLFNILFGDMSFVGPRPQSLVHYNLYTAEQKRYISLIKPGLTGIGSLIFRDEEGVLTRSKYDFDHTHDKIITPYKGDLEKWYYQNRSVSNYFKIIFLTAIGLFNSDLKVMHRFRDLPPMPDTLRELIG